MISNTDSSSAASGIADGIVQSISDRLNTPNLRGSVFPQVTPMDTPVNLATDMQGEAMDTGDTDQQVSGHLRGGLSGDGPPGRRQRTQGGFGNRVPGHRSGLRRRVGTPNVGFTGVVEGVADGAEVLAMLAQLTDNPLATPLGVLSGGIRAGATFTRFADRLRNVAILGQRMQNSLNSDQTIDPEVANEMRARYNDGVVNYLRGSSDYLGLDRQARDDAARRIANEYLLW